MDYFQGVVTEYLRADRSVFVNPECCIQLKEADTPKKGGMHWYCDIVAVDFRHSAVFLCEVTYSKSQSALHKRLGEWSANWKDLCTALARDCSLPPKWPVQPWLFVPDGLCQQLEAKLDALVSKQGGLNKMPQPKITKLEDVVPWKYRSWDRKPESLDRRFQIQ